VAEVHHREVDGVADAVGDDRRNEVAPGDEVQDAEQQAADRRLDHARRSLVEVREPERDVHGDEREDEGARTAPEELRCARQRVAAPDGFLAKRRQYPVEREVHRKQRCVPDQVVECRKVRPVAQHPVQDRHGHEELEQPHRDADGEADEREPGPAGRERQPRIPPAEAAQPQRSPGDQEQERRLAERHVARLVRPEHERKEAELERQELRAQAPAGCIHGRECERIQTASQAGPFSTPGA
jgi:hypothetical protein